MYFLRQLFLNATLSLSALTPIPALPSSHESPASPLPTIRYMPLGDSITAITCWRPMLWSLLNSSSLVSDDAWPKSPPKLDIVGSQYGVPPHCPPPRPTNGPLGLRHEGHSGIQATFMASQGLLPQWLETSPADIVSVILGTNDVVWAHAPPRKILDAYTTLVRQMQAANPKVKVIVAQIIPTRRIRNGEEKGVEALNAAIPEWARLMNHTSNGSSVCVVDLWTGFDAERDLRDDLHPNLSGDRLIAARLLPVLRDTMEAVKKDREEGGRISKDEKGNVDAQIKIQPGMEREGGEGTPESHEESGKWQKLFSKGWAVLLYHWLQAKVEEDDWLALSLFVIGWPLGIWFGHMYALWLMVSRPWRDEYWYWIKI